MDVGSCVRIEDVGADRRTLLKAACLGAGAIGLGMAGTSSAQTTSSDIATLNFLLNIEYLQGQFYTYALFGVTLDVRSLGGPGATGFGAQGAVTGGRKLSFPTTLLERFASEIRGEQDSHIRYLRALLPGDVVPQPALNIGGDATGAFTTLARLAGVVGPTQTFDPYASEDNFLLAAYLLEDVGVTAYRAAFPLIEDPSIYDSVMGMMAAEAQHSGAIRYQLHRRGVADPTLITRANQFSALRDSLDGTATVDQGLSSATVAGQTVANVVPADARGIVGTRTFGQVLNILYGVRGAATSGAFFPAGLNGTIRTSAA